MRAATPGVGAAESPGSGPTLEIVRRPTPRSLLYPVRFVSLIVCALAFAWLVRDTRASFIDVPFWDEWVLVPFLAHDAQHSLTLTELLTPHNEHIPLFPRIVLLSLARLTGWNLGWECVASIVLGVGTLVPLVLLTRRRAPGDAMSRHVSYGALTVVLLSLSQWENWMWGWQVEVFLSTAAVGWGLLLLTARDSAVWAVAAAACGMVATFSFGNGILFWVAALPLALVKWRRRPVPLVAWLITAAAVVAIYVGRIDSTALTVVGEHAMAPAAVLDLAVRVLGSALAGQMGLDAARIAGTVGIIVAALSLIAIRTSERHRLEDWAVVALLSYALLTAVLIALGRTVSDGEAIPSRYVTFGNLFWAALIMLQVERRIRLVMLVSIVCTMTTLTSVQCRDLYVDRKATLASGRSALFAPIDNPLVGRFFWDPQFVRGSLPVIRDLRLSIYDCARQISRDDWDAAARAIRLHGRPGDLVLTSTDWGAGCLSDRLRNAPAEMSVLSAGETLRRVQAAIANRRAAFLITGGDVVSFEARQWMERNGFPVYRSPVGALRLLFYPGRELYVSERLTPEEIVADHAEFAKQADLARTDGDRFFLHGWGHRQEDEGVSYRALLDQSGSIYVPVDRQTVQRLRLQGRVGTGLTGFTASNRLTVSINGIVVGQHDLTGTELDWPIDVARASWRHGGNVVRLSIEDVPQAELNRDEFPLIEFRHIAFD